MHSSSILITPSLPLPLTISYLPIKSNLQFLKNPSSFLKISSTPTKKNLHSCCKNPIFFASLQYSTNGCSRIHRPSSFLKISSTPTKQNLHSSCKNPIFLTSLQYSTNGCSRIVDEAPLEERLSVVDKVQYLALEFRSLSEPIDRVKRLLQYASILPPLCESARVQENRVFGCTTQVWLEVRMDNRGFMKFSVDSDSEITKGFCYCLIWVLGGAEPEEILSVTPEDLADMNVGLPKKGRSRVNTWHNVLFSMQSRTQNCVQDRKRAMSFQDLHSFVIRPHAHGVANESYLESEPRVYRKQPQRLGLCTFYPPHTPLMGFHWVVVVMALQFIPMSRLDLTEAAGKAKVQFRSQMILSQGWMNPLKFHHLLFLLTRLLFPTVVHLWQLPSYSLSVLFTDLTTNEPF